MRPLATLSSSLSTMELPRVRNEGTSETHRTLPPQDTEGRTLSQPAGLQPAHLPGSHCKCSVRTDTKQLPVSEISMELY